MKIEKGIQTANTYVKEKEINIDDKTGELRPIPGRK
jgi:hypothetical protein